MYNYPSRYEKRQTRFYHKAEQGLLYSEEIIYPSEKKKLIKEGFYVKEIEDFVGPNGAHPNRKLIVAEVSWKHAYGYSIPYIVHAYTIGLIETFPVNSCKNFAQELFIIANRKLNKSSK